MAKKEPSYTDTVQQRRMVDYPQRILNLPSTDDFFKQWLHLLQFVSKNLVPSRINSKINKDIQL